MKNYQKVTYFVLNILFLFLLNSQKAFSQWSTSPMINNLVFVDSSVYYDTDNPQIVSDGVGGAIIVWQNNHLQEDDIYIQRINSNGIIEWTYMGVPVSTAASRQGEIKIASDGIGGAFVVWEDWRNLPDKDIYAQRIDSNGNLVWQTDGIPICNLPLIQIKPRIISDGLGGAFICWEDNRNNSPLDIYAQHIDANGNFLWQVNGIPIGVEINQQYNCDIVSDGNNGIIITWEDSRTGTAERNIYAQRVGQNGNILWALNGGSISYSSLSSSKSASDDHGGAITVWNDSRNNIFYTDIYAQKIDGTGQVKWTLNGVAVSTAANNQAEAKIVYDGAGGVIVCWVDQRSGGSYDIFAQRIDSSGIAKWSVDGIAICTAPGNQWYPQICGDENGGAVITWQDERNSSTSAPDIYAQHVDSDGNILWAVNGIEVSIASNEQETPALIQTSDDGIIITWEDDRLFFGIYAQRINYDGSLGDPVSIEDELPVFSSFLLEQNFPNPFNPSTRIQYQISSITQVTIKIYDVLGNEVATLVNEEKPAGTYEVDFNTSSIKHHTSSGVYFYQLRVGNYIGIKKMLLVK
jgi:hypothetical protein